MTRTAAVDFAVAADAKQRHRLNRGGDRDANCALYQILVTRLARDEDTRLYVKRRISEGKTKKEAFRCLKRYIAREVHKTLVRTPALQAALDT